MTTHCNCLLLSLHSDLCPVLVTVVFYAISCYNGSRYNSIQLYCDIYIKIRTIEWNDIKILKFLQSISFSTEIACRKIFYPDHLHTMVIQ